VSNTPDSIRLEGLTVLLVEDDGNQRKVVRWMLEGLGCGVLEAEDGPAAILALRLAPAGIDLALLDFVMPSLDGLETLAALREAQPGLPAVLCSGQAEADCFRNQPVPACTFLGKPFMVQELAAAIRRTLA
jgi:CheY-like chemotaxis protein